MKKTQKNMNFTRTKAEIEFEILKARTPDAAILPFKNEILALCEAFGNSGQSGGSAPYTAAIISKAVKDLLLQDPITEITGDDDEWGPELSFMPDSCKQNKRCSALFKNPDGSCKYGDAIVWQGEERYDAFTGRVYVDDVSFELISSSQKVKFPFLPKTFYLDVVRVYISEEEAEQRGLHYIKDSFDQCYYSKLKDPNQLKEVFEYYVK